MKIYTTILVVLLLCGSTALSANKLSANPTSLDFSGTTTSPSASMTYVLTNAGPGILHVKVTPSAHTEVSLDNASFSSAPFIFTLVAGTPSAKTVYVRVVTPGSILLNEVIANMDTGNSAQTAPVTITGDIPLPITLASFKVNFSADTPVLTWTTLSEIENYGFYVEKSQDMTTWAEVANSFQEGYGTTVDQHSYSFIDHTLPVGNYYRLHQVDLDGTSHYSDAVSVVASVDAAPVAKVFALSQSYPNPFNPSTTISYSVPKEAHASLFIYNMLGEQVATLVNEVVAPGAHSVVWNASGLSSGTYFYVLKSDNRVQVKKTMLVK